MDLLGRYYTQDLFSSLLVKQLTLNSPQRVLELGVGGGALLKAAIHRWKNAKFYAADIDKQAIRKINKELPFVKIKYANSLNTNLPEKLMLLDRSIDIAICNPPYMKEDSKKKYVGLFNESGLMECLKLQRVTSDIIFLAQNLRLLKVNGQLGIILPDTLITGHDFQILRNSILSNHSVKGIIELPEKIFPKTEAKTHILIIEKSNSLINNVPLYIASQNGQCIDQIEVSIDELGHRMDYTFHKWNQAAKTNKRKVRLESIGCEIKRGSFTHAELKVMKRKYVHTTNLNNFSTVTGYKAIPSKALRKYTLAAKGDILIARVGRGCMGKASIVQVGTILISDCVYRIRVAPEFRDTVWKSIISNEGQGWFKANRHGVCAKVISKKDLLNFPIKL